MGKPPAMAVVCVVLACGGCAALDPPPPPPFRVAFLIEGDPGRPLAGAKIARGPKVVATTGADGRAELTLHGDDGQILDAEVKCPDGHSSPPRPVPMRLARLADGSRTPEYRVACPPTLRHVVVAVKADNGPNLPVVYLNKEIARTDASGAAHFALDLPPGNQFNVVLDTTENNKLKPASPSKPFTVGQTDDLLLYEQPFTVEKPKPVFVKKQTIVCLTCGKS